jgi:GDP-D-mannose dehydratase
MPGDPSLAARKLGWKPKTGVEEPAADMVREDLRPARRDPVLSLAARKIKF